MLLNTLKAAALILCGTLCLSLCSCTSTAGGPLLTATTNAVPTIVQTNAPVITATTVTNVVTVTNSIGQLVPQYVPVTVYTTNQVTVAVTNWTTNVVYQPSGTVTTILSTAQGINTVTGTINPFSGAIAAVLALATGGLSWYAKQKTNQVNQHLNTIQTLTSAAASLEPAAVAAYHAAVAKTGQNVTTAQMLTNAATAASQNLS